MQLIGQERIITLQANTPMLKIQLYQMYQEIEIK